MALNVTKLQKRILNKYNNAKRVFTQTIQQTKDELTTKIKKPIYKYDCNIQNTVTSQSFHDQCYSFDISKFSWSVCTTVLYKQKECTIHEIQSIPNQPDMNDNIIVIFDNRIVKQYHRYELESTATYIKQRRQLTKYCSIEIHEPTLQRWVPAFIDNYIQLTKSKQNKNWLCVNGTKYSRWSDQIRCSSPLLNLEIGSNIFIFDIDLHKWCQAKIIEIIKPHNERFNLNVFKVYYYKNNKIYQKYFHQCSASVALMTSLTKCCVTDENINNVKVIETDETDLKYYRLLLQGFTRKELISNSIGYMNQDVFSVLFKYIGCVYGLVMIVESKTWSVALHERDDNYLPKCHNRRKRSLNLSLSICSDDINNSLISVPRSPTPMHPMELKIKNKFIERDCFSTDNFEQAKNLFQNNRARYLGDDEIDDVDYDDKIMRHNNNLPMPDDDEIGQIECYECHNNNSDESFSLESGNHMDIQSDYGC